MRARGHSRSGPAGIAASAAMAALCGALAACQTEERIVSIHGLVHDLAESQMAGGGGDQKSSKLSSGGAGSAPAAPELDKNGNPMNPLRAEDKDGKITLVSQSPRHVIIHLRQTLMNGEDDLLYEQVLSDRTKQEYRKRGLDPRTAVDFLVENKVEIYKMLNKMPMGELTPGLFLKPMGGDVYRLQLPPTSERPRFTSIDFLWEWGVCRLVLIQ